MTRPAEALRSVPGVRGLLRFPHVHDAPATLRPGAGKVRDRALGKGRVQRPEPEGLHQLVVAGLVDLVRLENDGEGHWAHPLAAEGSGASTAHVIVLR